MDKMANANNHFSDNDRIFYSDGYQLAQSAIQKGFSNTTLFSAIESLYAAIDDLNDSILALAERQKMGVACHKGCHWCCHQAVYANSYELHYLSEKIKTRFTPEKISKWFMAAETKSAITSKMNEEEVGKYKSPCALLENGTCSVYDARPMACRIYLSTRLDTCLEFYHHPENEQNYPALIDFPLKAGRMMNEGFMAAMKEHGIETAEFRLEEGLRIVLKNEQPKFEN
jgi:Fe-S-cluster containining protein